MRHQKMGLLKRTFSWNRQKKSNRPSAASPAANGFAFNKFGPPSTPAASKPVKRSSSFDRFSMRSRSKTEGGASDSPKKASSLSKQLLFILLSRGPNGLGLELDATNTLVNIVKGGAADVQGYFKIGDTIASVDGVPLRGRLLQDVMDPRKVSYSFDVWRLARVEPDPAPVKPVRRALSFDRRRR